MENEAFVLEIINLTNQHRAQLGLSALSVDIDLEEAAQYHSDNMANLDFFDHQNLDGKRPADRAQDFGYETRSVGENIAWGYTTPQAVFTGWLNSSGHRANIENATWNEIGVGYYYLANDPGNYTGRHYWTQKFGRGDIENPGGSGTPTSGGGSTPNTSSSNALPPDFDPLQYGASHGDLIQAFGSNAAALEAHYLNHGRAEGRAYNLFNAAQYLAAHGDLRAAFGNDLQAATLHYLQFGYQEGRSLSGRSGTASNNNSAALPSGFDPLIYGASNHDLMAVLGTDAAALQSHYLTYGRQEGRSYNRFNAQRYLNAYDDLLSIYGNDLQGATLHYMQFGRHEGRSMLGGIFNAAQYLASYQDLITAFGYNLDAGTVHYQNLGQFENRRHDLFDEGRYLASNPDLIQAFGYDLEAATSHYIRFGSQEGRGHGTFDAATYLQNYGDLRAAFGSDLNAATQHYIQSGFAEGRRPV
ncbi:CAP domain-containing protein [Leptolyngbya iicbica]|uniref:CAP domain-containing protein n=2 Tax=Cyanophyceae TaxID=3028117 RepID=A0A4Q7DYR8_9CYAN|nr:CAP domain-containing protein [Leptolyngbya sp. LK]RZM74421.1 CAP domain-containing protein [Leptolyngbya sp. LK]